MLVDINAWGALAVAEAWGGPWGVLGPITFGALERIVKPLVNEVRERVGVPLAKVRTAIAARKGAIRIAGAYRAAGGPAAAADLCEQQLRHVSVADNAG